jgi:hypothetical protein
MTMTTVEAPHVSENDVYDPDDVGLQDSPLLKPLKPRLQPTPSPPPELPEAEESPPAGSSKTRKQTRRFKSIASQGDAVLINLLGGGKALEVARTAATQLLPSDDEMSDGSQKGVEIGTMDKTGHSNELAALAAGALKVHAAHAATAPIEATAPAPEDINLPRFLNGHDGNARTDILSAMKVEPSDEAISHLAPSLSTAKSRDELAPIQEKSPKSEKSNGFTLPSITAQLGDLKQLTEAVTATVDKDANGAHRPSFSQSPLGPPLFQVTPAHQGGQNSPPISPNDGFRRELPSPGRGPISAVGPYFYNSNPRRPSIPSEGQNYPATASVDYSSSATETPSTDQSGSTPAGIPAGIDRMSIDGITNPQIGGFQCTYPGCTAQPFQTQYLLNSHANVHSSNRPHYCPVKGCPRGEGGKGFKRKNEMIRHGLVHESPGYVCPYCVDREHKYPRPDNLQRQVT